MFIGLSITALFINQSTIQEYEDQYYNPRPLLYCYGRNNILITYIDNGYLCIQFDINFADTCMQMPSGVYMDVLLSNFSNRTIRGEFQDYTITLKQLFAISALFSVMIAYVGIFKTQKLHKLIQNIQQDKSHFQQAKYQYSIQIYKIAMIIRFLQCFGKVMKLNQYFIQLIIVFNTVFLIMNVIYNCFELMEQLIILLSTQQMMKETKLQKNKLQIILLKLIQIMNFQIQLQIVITLLIYIQNQQQMKYQLFKRQFQVWYKVYNQVKCIQIQYLSYGLKYFLLQLTHFLMQLNQMLYMDPEYLVFILDMKFLAKQMEKQQSTYYFLQIHLSSQQLIEEYFVTITVMGEHVQKFYCIFRIIIWKRLMFYYITIFMILVVKCIYMRQTLLKIHKIHVGQVFILYIIKIKYVEHFLRTKAQNFVHTSLKYKLNFQQPQMLINQIVQSIILQNQEKFVQNLILKMVLENYVIYINQDHLLALLLKVVKIHLHQSLELGIVKTTLCCWKQFLHQIQSLVQFLQHYLLSVYFSIKGCQALEKELQLNYKLMMICEIFIFKYTYLWVNLNYILILVHRIYYKLSLRNCHIFILKFQINII
ncbi:Transmembrane domain-containing protein [Spironucleus salmonicida]|uniref:Transmembrane domain-containing protein n=1 Tax=Spironucleus salmonicida TaxID=348837 RepID=A0A9P8RUD9_9EUKA|nr:Transmembrane domain-containing protein [Spironucleus salmonicida]